MSLMKPKLPEGDYWKVERITYDAAKPLRIAWVHPHADGVGFYHVEARDFRPKRYRLAFWVVYWYGLRRIAADKRQDARDARNAERIRRAEQIATRG